MLAAGLRSLGAVLLAVVVLLSGGWSLRRSAPSPGAPPSPAPGRLREVAPPTAIQRQRQRLDSHDPSLRILEPRSGTLLPEGPWTLELSIDDWPALETDGAGPGTHVVVQLDEEPPVRIGGTTEAVPSPTGPRRLTVPMPALSPGSHRLTAYAARPWGEAVKAPGAWQQIRLHRVAANPLALPPPGTPQLIDTTPTDLIDGEPVLIDWLLLDTPLQPLSGDEPRWRLRITINGDSFLVDRQTPIWLEGLRPGSNALVLELLDGLGEPLNPPFNALVRELRLEPTGKRRWPTGLEQPLTTADAVVDQRDEQQEQEEEKEEEEEPVPVPVPVPQAADAPPALPASGTPAPPADLGPPDPGEAAEDRTAEAEKLGSASPEPTRDDRDGEDDLEAPSGDGSAGQPVGAPDDQPPRAEPPVVVPPAAAASLPVAPDTDGSLERPRSNGALEGLRARFGG